MKKSKLTYQDAFNQLKEIYQNIHEDKIPMELLPEAIQKAKKLVQYCEQILRSIETEIDSKEEE
jgi:exodeoxyribonuclease VII small subunit